MYNLDVYINDKNKGSAQLRQLSPKRDWMNPGIYNCYPVTMANVFGYGIYFDEDISFVWDGENDNPPKSLSGKKYLWEGRSGGIVSFSTGLVFKSPKNVSLLTIPVPNHFDERYFTLSSILSTSFFTGELSIACKINEKYINKEIVISAGTDIACVIPISLSELNNSNLNIISSGYPFERIHDRKSYIDSLHDYFNKTGKRLRLYKKGIDENGNKVGEHEVNNIIMNITYEKEGNGIQQHT